MRARRTGLVALLALLLMAPGAAAASPLRKLDWALRQRSAARAPQGSVLVDVYIHGRMSPAVAALRRLGMDVSAVSMRRPERMVEGPLPADRLDDVARLSLAKAVLTVPAPITNAGVPMSEGDAPHHGPQVRALGDAGGGIPVGIMSDSINRVGGGVSDSQSSGNLPADVRVLADGPPGSTDEGRAMAEIVYDEAPSIPTFLFATAFGGGPATKAANIGLLASNGARIIVDDTGFLSEPMFQDGVVAQAVDQATAKGAAYFVSAGNQARQSWEGTFTPVGSPAQNDFDPGPGQDLRQTVATVPAGDSLTLVLQWAEPWGHASTDFALDVFDGSSATPDFTVNSDNIATGIPMESVTLTNSGSSSAAVSIAIRRVAGSGTPLMKWLADGDFGIFTPEYANSDAIQPDAASARSAITVAANRFDRAGTVEPFSSRGPSVTHLFDAAGNPAVDVRPKPDVAGADGVSTSLSGFDPFFGTSAAAPSAAGVAALLLSAKPSLPVDELNAIMREPSNAIDCAAPGFPDADCGSGFILADGKLGRVLDSTPPSVAANLSPAVPDGPNGWYRGNVGVSWSVADDGSPIGRETGCGPVSVTIDSVTTFSCAALSAGGTSTVPVTIKRDASPPSTPTFTGIKSGAFNAKRLPGRSRVRCTATDPTSGVDSCRVSGFSRRPGTHTLTAVATNDAGLTSTARLRYRVRPAAARRLHVRRRIALATLRTHGIAFSVSVRVRPTTLVARLFSKGKVVGRVHRRSSRGTAHMRVRLNSRGRRLRPGVIKLVVKAGSPRASTATLQANLRVRG